MKNNFKKIFLTVIGILFLSFFVPQFAQADAFGVLDIFGMQLDALDFLDSGVNQFIVFVTLVLAESMIFLGIAGSVLDWAMQMPVNLMTTSIVTGGWQFIVGISNLIIILSFVWTGLSMILKGDSAQGQKRLFTLIGIALIVNFSLFFMGALVDIAGYIQLAIINTFGGVGGSLSTMAVQSLMTISTAYFQQMIAICFTAILSSLIPIANVAFLVGGGIAFVTLSINGWVPILIFTIILNFLVGIMFFLLSAMFLMRICFLWILAILAPLAIVSYQSEIPIIDKFFGQWLKLLSEWLFIGIPLTFLLALGFKLFTETAVVGEGAFANVQSLSSSIPETFSNYIFLFLYMIVVFIMSKSFMPTMGKQVISTVTGGAKTAAKFMAPRMQKNLNRWEARTERMQKGKQKMEEDRASLGADAFSEKYPDESEFRGARLNSMLLKPVAGFRKYVKREIPGLAQKTLEGDLKKQAEGMTHLTAEQLQSRVSAPVMSGGLRINTPGSFSREQIASALIGMKSSEINKFVKNNADNAGIMNEFYAAARLGDSDLAKKAERGCILGNEHDEERIKLINREHDLRSVVKDTTGKDVTSISVDAIELSKQLRDVIAEEWKPKDFKAYANESNKFVDVINNNLEEIKRSAASNEALLRSFDDPRTLFVGKEGGPSLEGIPEGVKSFIAKSGDPIAKIRKEKKLGGFPKDGNSSGSGEKPPSGFF